MKAGSARPEGIGQRRLVVGVKREQLAAQTQAGQARRVHQDGIAVLLIEFQRLQARQNLGFRVGLPGLEPKGCLSDEGRAVGKRGSVAQPLVAPIGNLLSFKPGKGGEVGFGLGLRLALEVLTLLALVGYIGWTIGILWGGK